jgi:outer membrane protein assembly factor BamB
MDETTKEETAQADAGGVDDGPTARVVRPRLWPAVIIVTAHLSVTIGIALFASVNTLNFVGYGGAPLIAALLLVLWWLLASRVPVLDRFAGLILLGAALGWIVWSQEAFGVMLLMVALPAFTTSLVALLVITKRFTWARRRLLLVLLIATGTGFFTLLRSDGISGNLTPVLAWRWSASPEAALEGAAAEHTVAEGLPQQPGESDWPEFRGPLRDSRVPGVTFATDWQQSPPKELWRRPVGLAYSSFAVVGDYLFTQEQRGEEELVVCYRAATGDEVWTNAVANRYENNMGHGPRATPTFHEGKLYTMGPSGVLQCLDASTGKTVWKRDLTADVGASVPGWGFASSPLVVDDRVIVFAGAGDGKGVAAYDRASGDLAWSAGSGRSGYCSGQFARIAGVPQVLFTSGFGLQAFAPESGEKLWEHAWDMGSNARVVQPLFVNDNTVAIGSSFGKGTRLVEISRVETAWNVAEKWTTKRFRPYFNDQVFFEGHCYGFDGNRLSCIDMATGERLWAGERYGGQILLLSDMGVLLVLSEKGEVALVRATPDSYNKLASFHALSGKTWNHPVIANGKLFVRNAEEAACYDLPVMAEKAVRSE